MKEKFVSIQKENNNTNNYYLNKYELLIAIFSILSIEFLDAANILLYKEIVCISEEYSIVNNFILIKSFFGFIIAFCFIKIKDIKLSIENSYLSVLLIKNFLNYLSIFCMFILLFSSSTFIVLALTISSSFSLILSNIIGNLINKEKINKNLIIFSSVCILGTILLASNYKDNSNNNGNNNNENYLGLFGFIMILMGYYLSSSFGIYLQKIVNIEYQISPFVQLIMINIVMFVFSFVISLFFGVFEIKLEIIILALTSSIFSFVIMYTVTGIYVKEFGVHKLCYFNIIKLILVAIISGKFFDEKVKFLHILCSCLNISYFYYRYFE